jgi:hypothetical protein
MNVAASAQDLLDALGAQVELAADLARRRLAAELLVQLALGADELVDGLDHVHGHADGARLVGDRPGDGLADPPGRIGRELVALGVVELLDRTDQAEIALLDQVEEQQATADVALGDRYDEAEVGLDQPPPGQLAAALDALEVADADGIQVRPAAEHVARRKACLHPLGEVDLLLGAEQGHAADLQQVEPDRVARGRAGRTAL